MELKVPVATAISIRYIGGESITWSWKGLSPEGKSIKRISESITWSWKTYLMFGENSIVISSLNPLHGVERLPSYQLHLPLGLSWNPLHGVERLERQARILPATSHTQESITWSWKDLKRITRYPPEIFVQAGIHYMELKAMPPTPPPPARPSTLVNPLHGVERSSKE